MADVEINGCRLICTSVACPEQYDVFLGREQIGYLRLRHGHFRADYPRDGGNTVFEANPDGDGIFTSEERDRYLRAAVQALLQAFLAATATR